MFAKIAYHASNTVVSAFMLITLAFITLIVFVGWGLPAYYRKLELRFVYHGDEMARSRDEFRD